MIELAALSLLLRIANVGYEPVFATRVVCAGLDALHAFLTDPRNYRCGNVRVRPSSSPEVAVVLVSCGRRKVMRYTWILTPGRGTTEVDLAVQLETRGPLTRLALLLGGRGRLRRQLDAMLASLARSSADAAEQVVTREPEPHFASHAG